MTLDDKAIYPNLSRCGANYYVYAFYDQDQIFYVGKGKGRRCLVHFGDSSLKHSNRKNAKIKSILNKGCKVHVKLLAVNLTEREALVFESKLIEDLGIKADGGILCNSIYGDISSFRRWTEDHKREMSLKMRGKNSNSTVELVEKAKLLAHYRGFTAKKISELEEFSEFSENCIKRWCRGDKFSYVRPDLKFGRELTKEKKLKTFEMLDQGFTPNEVVNILGLDYGSVSWYIKSRKFED